MQNRIKIYGPPGTGKTTYCLDLLCEHLQAGDRVLFISFTRAAKFEAFNRLIKLFGTVPEHATVSTIHALCLHMLGVGKDCLADRHPVKKKFFEALGVTGTRGKQRDRVSDSLDFYSRLRNMEAPWDYQDDVPFNDPENVKAIIQRFENWKRKEGYVDFTDLLQRVARGEGEVPKFDVVIIDEAQDLTRLQWKVVDRLYKDATTVYVVGDDDQNVYSFLGADISCFLSWPSDAIRVLETSYRLPANLLAYSQLLAKQIRFRQDKQVAGQARHGSIYLDLPLVEALHYNCRPTELFLARNAYMHRRVHDLLLSRGIPFAGNNSPFTDLKNYAGKVFQAISVLHGWRDRALSTKDWKTIKGVMRPALVGLMEDKYPAAIEHHPEGIPPLRTIFKQEDYDKSGWWAMFFPNLSAKLEAAFKLAIKNYGVARCAAPTLELSTIHGAKGKEADRVYVCSALTDKLYRTMENKDDEHRLFYVAVTRSRQELFILDDEQAGVRRYPFPKLY